MSISKDELLQTIRSLAESKGRNWLSNREFCDESGISESQVLRFFPRWNDAVVAAGLTPLTRRGRPDKEKGHSREELLQKVREVATKRRTECISVKEFSEATGICGSPIRRLFGNWQQFVEEAGLRIHPQHKVKIADTELFEDYLRVLNESGSPPSCREFGLKSKYSHGVWQNRFAGFKNFRKLAIQHGIDQGIITATIQLDELEEPLDNDSDYETVYKALDDRPILGEHLNFRGLLHAPVNEMGVVYLFGMLSEELGFVVESVQAGFPDCEGKRRLKKDRWQRVRIEFEYVSSNYLRHGHDITKCDLIVYWMHDWKDCPLEVLSLKDYIHHKAGKYTLKEA